MISNTNFISRVFKIHPKNRLIIDLKKIKIKYVNDIYIMYVQYFNPKRNYKQQIQINHLDFLNKDILYFIYNYQINFKYEN